MASIVQAYAENLRNNQEHLTVVILLPREDRTCGAQQIERLRCSQPVQYLCELLAAEWSYNDTG